MSGFFFAAASVASPRLKPTVVMLLHFSFTIASTLSAYSDGEFDSTSAVCTPRSVLAFSRPSWEVWLNDLSLKPPESETMHALKSGCCSAGAELLLSALGVGSALLLVSRSPQPANVSAATPMTAAATRAVFLTAPPGVCDGDRVGSRTP